MATLRNAEAELVDVPEGFPVEVRIYQCARKWEELASTQLEGVRHCDACSQMVYHVEDAKGIELAIAQSICVRITRPSGGNYVGKIETDNYVVPAALSWDE